MSDLHFSPSHPEALKRINETFLFIKEKVKPLYTILSGDITDNIEGPSIWTPAYPNEGHFILYRKTIEETKFPQNDLIEVLGNHDTGARIYFPDEHLKYFVNYQKMKDNFYVQTYIKNNVRIIAFSPIHFPTGHTSLHFVIPLYTEELDALEEALDETNNENINITIFTMHYATVNIFPLESVKSTKTKRNLKEILNDPKYNIYAMLTGHTHPTKRFDSSHFGNIIELTSTALLEQDGFGILSIDNQRINYHMYYQNQTKLAILASPTPNKISTRIFNDEYFQIRVVSLTSNAKDFYVSGDINGKLSFQRKIGVNEEMSLYSMNVRLKPGNYKIQISGDLNETCEFSIGVPVGPFTEYVFVELSGKVVMFYFCVIGTYIAIILITMILPNTCFSSFQRHFEWLNNKNNPPKSEYKSFWIHTIFGGPITMGKILQQFNLSWKVFFIFLILSPFILPIGVYYLEQNVGFYTFFGVYYNGEKTFDIFSFFFSYTYISYILISLLNLFILLKFNDMDISLFFDIVYNIFLLLIGIFFWHTYGHDRNNPPIFQITIQFHLIPLSTFIIFVVFLVTKLSQSNVDKMKSE